MQSSTTAQARHAVLPRIDAARQEMTRDRARGLSQLNAIFREGTLPAVPLNGPTRGEMLTVDMAPGVTPLVEGLLRRRMPWSGKTFDAANAKGTNLFYPGFVPVARVCFPFYRDYRRESADRVSGFPFRTYVGPGLKDPDRQVLKIDYDMPVNPRFSIRRILDELVQVDDNYYLGKAYFKLPNDAWHLVFYFSLQRT